MNLDQQILSDITTFYFYVLVDPRDKETKYVGRTVDVNNRFRNHLYEARKNNRNKRERWISLLLSKNLKPELKVIYSKRCNVEEAATIEKTLVKKLSKRFNLKNDKDNYLGAVFTGKLVYQYNLEGKLINTYQNSNQAYIDTGIKDCNILRCCNNENGYGTKTAGGYFWSFVKYDRYPHKYDKEWRKVKGKAVVQYSKKGEKINEFITARQASKETGVSYKHISACCRGNRKTSGGYKWKFKQ